MGKTRGLGRLPIGHFVFDKVALTYGTAFKFLFRVGVRQFAVLFDYEVEDSPYMCVCRTAAEITTFGYS